MKKEENRTNGDRTRRILAGHLALAATATASIGSYFSIEKSIYTT